MRRRHRGAGWRARERGQSVVEFAVVFPLMVILLLAILDLARVYTTILSVESGAREAADYGTTLGAGRWAAGAPMDATVAAMNERACLASRNLPDYTDADADPSTGCENPGFAYCVTSSVGGACGAVDPAAGCDDPLRPVPCTVTVTLTHEFRLYAPFSVEILGSRFGVPATITIERDSTFAMTDIDLAASPPAP
jgi:hypothetical protein